jgi:hypothetical protein
MKKEIVDKLIKVANNLDSLGYMREANIVDRVAKKIVVSANPENNYKLTLDQASTLKVTGDYARDINNYKSLIYSYYSMNDDKKYYDAKTLKAYADSFLNGVKKAPLTKYSNEERIAFLNQAERIWTDARQVDINDKLGDKNTESLNEYLALYDIANYDGTLKKDIKNMTTFNQRWNQFLNDPIVKKLRAESPLYYKKQLGTTYKILTAKLPYSSD